MLNPTQIEHYHRNGYLLVPDVLDQETVAELQCVSREFIARSAEVTQSNEMYDIGPGHAPGRLRVRRLKRAHTHHPIYEKVMRSDAIVDIVAALVGPGVRFDHSKLNYKPREANGAIEWHQDWAFYPYTNDDMLAVGVLIEDVTEENGPMMVVPGSHKGPISIITTKVCSWVPSIPRMSASIPATQSRSPAPRAASPSTTYVPSTARKKTSPIRIGRFSSSPTWRSMRGPWPRATSSTSSTAASCAASPP